MPHYMIDARIEVEASDLAEAEGLADNLSRVFDNLRDSTEGDPVLFVDDVRLTEGEQE